MGCQDNFPTKMNLLKMCIISFDMCVHCKLNVETSSHVLFHCSSTHVVWLIRLPKVMDMLNTVYGFQSLIWELMLADLSSVVLLLTIAWGLWKYRNHCLFQQQDCRVM